jgi:hypothetical protein
MKVCRRKERDSHRLSDKNFFSNFFTKFFSVSLIWYALERQCSEFHRQRESGKCEEPT